MSQWIFIFIQYICNINVKFSKYFSNYLSKKNLTLKTLTNGISTQEELPFITAMDRYATQIFYISTISDIESINMTDKYSYELFLIFINGKYNEWILLIL